MLRKLFAAALVCLLPAAPAVADSGGGVSSIVGGNSPDQIDITYSVWSFSPAYDGFEIYVIWSKNRATDDALSGTTFTGDGSGSGTFNVYPTMGSGTYYVTVMVWWGAYTNNVYYPNVTYDVIYQGFVSVP